jgi:hypothetical protein
MVDVIWFYEKDYDNGSRYPDCPVGSYQAEIAKLDFTDHNRIDEVAEDLKQMGADFILVMPDFWHHKGFAYPHIAVSFPDEEQLNPMCQKIQGDLIDKKSGEDRKPLHHLLFVPRILIVGKSYPVKH